MSEKDRTLIDIGRDLASKEMPGGWRLVFHYWKLIMLVAVVLGLFAITRYHQIDRHVIEMREWIEALGPAAPIFYTLLIALAMVLMLPCFPLGVLGGIMFGFFEGVFAVSVGATAGAGACFLIARYVAHETAQSLIARWPRFKEIDELTEHHGAWIVAVLRLVPFLPFNILNYAFGLTRIRFWTFMLFSWLCMLPGVIAVVLFGEGFVMFLIGDRERFTLLGIFLICAAMVGAITWVCWRVLMRTLEADEEKYHGPPPTEPVALEQCSAEEGS